MGNEYLKTILCVFYLHIRKKFSIFAFFHLGYRVN
jgi:hypothetical protein